MMNTLISDEIVEFIMQAKSRMPAGWLIHTDETDYYLILDIPMKEFEKFSITDKIRIAEVTNELCQRIKTTGCPCYIQKI